MNVNRLIELEKKAIRFIRTIANATEGETLYAGNSGGKDSAVVDCLLQLSGIDYHSYHTNTTLDPPDTIKHIQKFYPHTEILKPNESFYQLIRRKGLPTRLNRYCCEHLKEYGSVAKMVFEGVRASESRKRKGRDKIQCDSRKWQQGAQHIYPIYEWEDKDVWDYIKFRKIDIAPHYERAKKLGLNRLGCVGCPLVSPEIRRKEFILYPKILINITKAIAEGMKNNPQWKLTVATGGDAELAIKWWLTRKTMEEYFNHLTFIGSREKGWKVESKKTTQTSIKF